MRNNVGNSPRPRPKRSEVPIRIPSIPHLLIPSPLTPTPPNHHRGGGGAGPLCEPINEPQGPAVKFRLLQWIWKILASPPFPPPPLPRPPPLAGDILRYIYIYIYIERVIYSLSMHKPYHSSPRRRCTPISCESKKPQTWHHVFLPTYGRAEADDAQRLN